MRKVWVTTTKTEEAFEYQKQRAIRRGITRLATIKRKVERTDDGAFELFRLSIAAQAAVVSIEAAMDSRYRADPYQAYIISPAMKEVA